MSLLHRCPAPPLRILAVDFDKTLTTADTTADVVNTVKLLHPEHRPFQWFTDEYMKDYESFDAHWSPILASRQGHYDRRLLDDYSEGLRPVEEASLQRITEHKILSGATHQDLRNGGALVKFRQGAAALLNRAVGEMPVYVVSVNWSKDFIYGALQANGVMAENITIYSNDSEFDIKGVSTGVLKPEMVVAGDKVNVMARIKRDLAGARHDQVRVAYAGDSLTDLPAMMDADLGIFVGNSSSVTSWCKNMGIKFGQPHRKHNTIHSIGDTWDSVYDLVQKHLH
ncbi:hypothetical protein DL89DRAFT_290188 [Linderina pennispora]|uniref:HAD-like protein n=1 Tax=Linderina pennispora TaxID=61395 RepID=A0A1Y1WMA2_9FUNG|nr:uncharacterized protein DL89DRAFT_290188 [Linderina pennispora]ORX74691.1 hypothetical protein DL89DRAFT_290188 [Linderina pennispora]